jgi:hypothetical protein
MAELTEAEGSELLSTQKAIVSDRDHRLLTAAKLASVLDTSVDGDRPAFLSISLLSPADC